MSLAESVSEKGGALLFLLPEEITWSEETNVRLSAEIEEEAIKSLADTIKKDGQIQPILVRRTGEDNSDLGLANGINYEGVVGRRRTAAIALINAEKTSKEEPLRVKAICDVVEDPFRTAIMENLKRKDFNPLDMARNIGTIRERQKWAGGKGTKKVAEYLGVSPAYVTTHEALLKLPQEKQDQIASGEIKRDYAFELLNVKEEKRGEVEATAQQLAEEEEETAAKKTGRKKKDGVKATAKHVRTASRQHQAAISLKPLSRTEILAYFEKIQTSGSVEKFGYSKGAAKMFAKTLLMWAEGKIKDETLTKYYAELAQKADRGPKDEEPAKDEAKEQTKKKAAKKKSAPKK